ncbi:MAG: hypothetical protein KJZ87_21765 [Thermoguttaceae bacterium]|nr:hypothetical protein [Thermoguttaceae bacterium]
MERIDQNGLRLDARFDQFPFVAAVGRPGDMAAELALAGGACFAGPILDV